jgi:hypothetical protein
MVMAAIILFMATSFAARNGPLSVAAARHVAVPINAAAATTANFDARLYERMEKCIVPSQVPRPNRPRRRERGAETLTATS